MPSLPSRGRQHAAPVEIPSTKVHKEPAANLSPATPPKAVRFAPPPTSMTRPLNNTEAWSLYHFETHARQCGECYDPNSIHIRHGQLCANGHALAQDVAMHVYHHSGEVYSTHPDSPYKSVRVELSPGYDQVRALLKAMDRELKSRRRRNTDATNPSPVVSYDRTYPIPERRVAFDDQPKNRKEKRNTVIVEPAVTEQRQRRTDPKPKERGHDRRRADVPEETKADNKTNQPKREHRGSLYYDDVERYSRDRRYRVEVREPEGGQPAMDDKGYRIEILQPEDKEERRRRRRDKRERKERGEHYER